MISVNQLLLVSRAWFQPVYPPGAASNQCALTHFKVFDTPCSKKGAAGCVAWGVSVLRLDLSVSPGKALPDWWPPEINALPLPPFLFYTLHIQYYKSPPFTHTWNRLLTPPWTYLLPIRKWHLNPSFFHPDPIDTIHIHSRSC